MRAIRFPFHDDRLYHSVNYLQADTMSKDYISVGDAANRLGMTPQRVRMLIAAGELKASKVGGLSYVVDERSLEKAIQRRKDNPDGRVAKPPE
jgi:excisionase family DNA binding protein